MKSVLTSIQPYWVFLIIARKMGWDIPQEKTVEVRKDYPKDKAWNKVTHIYCSKNRKSFNRIPVQYQPLMEKLLGKVIGEFVCDEIISLNYDTDWSIELPQEGYFFDKTPSKSVLLNFEPCLTNKEMISYGKEKTLYGWHISDLIVYDKPKELGEFRKPCSSAPTARCYPDNCERCPWNVITRPPMSWCYVEGL